MTWLVLSLALAQLDGGAPTPEGPRFTPLVDAFGELGARFAPGAEAQTAFSVPRAQAGVEVSWQGAEARVLVEGVYATKGGALLGVSGDSLTVRVREAWAGYTWRFLSARLGLVSSVLVPELEKAFEFRQLAADGLEAHGLLAPADYGARLTAQLPLDLGLVGVSLTNGEGYTARELNPGKNVELAAVIHPVPGGALAPLSLVGLATFGSTGLPPVSTQRYGGGAQWSSPAWGAGVNVFSAHGLLGDPTRTGLLVQAFARATLFEHLLLAAKLTSLRRDMTTDDSVTDLLAGVGARVAFVDVFLAWQQTLLSGAARAALPGVEAGTLRLVVRARWPEPTF
jgi:hypothetical protein